MTSKTEEKKNWTTNQKYEKKVSRHHDTDKEDIFLKNARKSGPPTKAESCYLATICKPKEPLHQ